MERRRGALRGMVEVGGSLRFVLTPSSVGVGIGMHPFQRVHDELDGSQQTLQLRLGRIGASLRSLWNNLLEL